MLTGIHFLLTYACTYECDHCFLYCSPNSEGTFTIDQIRCVLEDAKRIPTVEWVYFEGGEAFMYYPVMLEGLRLAKGLGFKTGVVTNCYWATSENDAALWLGPLMQVGLDDLSLSDDEFHHGETSPSPARAAATAAARLGMPSASICIEKPTVKPPSDGKGDPVIGGGALFKGRAVDKLTEGLPVRPPGGFTQCIHEELVAPKRVHLDAFGNVHVATLLHGGISVISPDGQRYFHLPLPDRYVTNLCFGGRDMRTAYVTLSGSGRLIAIDGWPTAGLRLNFNA